MRHRTMVNIILGIGIVALACFINKRKGSKKMFRVQHKPGTWKRCSICGEYSHTLERYCDSPQHTIQAVLNAVSTLQLARVTTVLTSKSARQNIESQEEYYAFGSYFLWLEENTERKWDSTSALIVFLLSEEDQLRFYDLMSGYEVLVASYLPSGLVTLWLALHKDTAKVVQ